MTLQQLACFCAAAQEGSFSAAARDLRLSQPSVSAQVHRLEIELGTRLVVSHGRGIRLTADGRAFQRHAEGILAAVDAAAAAVGRLTSRGRQKLTFGLPRNAPYYPFDEVVERALRAQSELQLRLPGQNSSEVAEAVRTGELQAAVVILPVDPDGLDVRPLFRDEVLFVSVDPHRVRHPISIEEAAAAQLILYDTSAGFADPTRRQLAARAQELGIALRPHLDVEHPESAFQLAARGLGDTIAARALTRGPSFPPLLHCVSFDEPLYDNFAVIRSPGVISVELQTLLNVLGEWASELPVRFGLERP